MAKRVSAFDPSKWGITCMCSNCFTRVQLGCTDVRYKDTNDYRKFTYRCPVCARPVALPNNFLPAVLTTRNKLVEYFKEAAGIPKTVVPDNELTESQLRTRIHLRERQARRRQARVPIRDKKEIENAPSPY